MSFIKYAIVQSENKNIRRQKLEREDEELESQCLSAIKSGVFFDKAVVKYDLDRT